MSVFVNYYVLSYFSLTLVNMVLQTVPMFTCLFAYWLLGERIEPHEVVMILLAFFAVSMMIVGGADDSDVKQVSKLAIIMLIFNPILISAGII